VSFVVFLTQIQKSCIVVDIYMKKTKAENTVQQYTVTM